ncbi:MAG: hypothetical protein Q4C60_10915 [Eubacteriales bacterium]|nr:hypothetical protein [Eubacteriales bacterium]
MEEKALLNRLEKYGCHHLLFIRDFSVPFDNNISERDLRSILRVKSVREKICRAAQENETR